MKNGRRTYGEISALVHPICFMLAAGSSGAGPLPDCLVAAIAISHCRNRVGRRFILNLGYRDAALPDHTQNLISGS
jgi:hypothetical protein